MHACELEMTGVKSHMPCKEPPGLLHAAAGEAAGCMRVRCE
jgi:hypothetical protein